MYLSWYLFLHWPVVSAITRINDMLEYANLEQTMFVSCHQAYVMTLSLLDIMILSLLQYLLYW